jgi:hypothetical protein
MDKLRECLEIAERHGNSFMAENIKEEIEFELKRIKLEETLHLGEE